MPKSGFPGTIVEMFIERVRMDGPNPALFIKDTRADEFRALTWNDLAVRVRRVAAALLRLGVQPGDRVVQISENCPEWIICDLAIQMTRGVHVPLHASLAGDQFAEQIADCDPKVVMFSDKVQAKKLAPVEHHLPRDVRFVQCQKSWARIGRREILSLEGLEAEISESDAEAAQAVGLEEAWPDEIATILYTSGTTGKSKGVMLSQTNFVFNTLATIAAFEMKPDDSRLCFLPFSHVFARTSELYSWIALGSELALAESREKIVRNCAEIRPTALIGVPFFYDRLYQRLLEKGTAVQPGSLQRLLGGRVRGCISGGAPLGSQVIKYFEMQEIPLLQGYGMTETSPVISVCTDKANKLGTVGKPIPGIDVKIADDGEVLTRGPHVMVGYWKNDDATAEIIRNGWLHTGDLGEIDDEGFLRITGRRKEMIATSGGKKIAPSKIEVLLTEDPLIVQAMVIGEGRDYLTALIVPDPDGLKAEIKRMGLWVFSKAGAVSHPKVVELYRQRIEQRLRKVSYYEQVRKFRILDQGFTPDNGLMTATLKLKRDLIKQTFAKQIEAMYAQPKELRAVR
ncbi:MAG: long-chain fatty acid--CoA ligase [Planctomycetales bacterium]|nr:long-chain fatty acid--CoA ligase [Planctomycetales bacterium]